MGNLAEHLAVRAERDPGQMALCRPVYEQQSWQLADELTYAELHQRVVDAATGLVAAGITEGTRTALMVPPSIELFTLTFALFRIGAIPIFVDPGMGVRHLKTCLNEARPVAFIGIPKAHLARVLMRWSPKTIRQCVTVGSRSWWTTWGSTFSQVLQQGQALRSVNCRASQPDETAAILFTSGSTGTPKGAVYSQQNFQSQIEALRELFQIEPGEIDLCTFPLFALFAPALGMSAIIPEMDFTRPAQVNPENILGPVQTFEVNNLFGSPALLNRVGRYAVANNRKLPSLKRVLTAGAPVAPQIIQRFQSLLSPSAQVFTPYGATESLPVSSIGSAEILGETWAKTKAGAGTCVGRAAPQMRVEVIRLTDDPIPSWSDERILAVGEIGEIAVRGPVVTSAYDQRPEANHLAKIVDHDTGEVIHRMGDVGYKDAEGRLWFCGRKAHRVVTPQRTWFTDPVEGVFNQHPAVYRSALIGLTQAGQTVPAVCIEIDPEGPSLSRKQLLAELLALAQKFETTRDIRTILFHPSFPVDIRHNSKIFREKLAEWGAKQQPES